MLLATRCPLCRRLGPAPCSGCRGRLQPLRRSTLVTVADVVDGVDALVAPFAYRDEVRALVAALKFRNDRAAVGWVAEEMVAALGSAPVGLPPGVVVTWAPTSGPRRRRRGYDQAELLARAVAHRLGLPVRPLLRRRSRTAVTGRRLAERAGTVLFTARTVPAAPSVLLVDDVCTTGTTLQAAAAALRDGGSTTIIALVAARTPPPNRGQQPRRGHLG